MYSRLQLLKWYFPLRINFFVLLVAIIFAVKQLKKINLGNSNFEPIVYIMCKVIVLFGIALLVFSLLSILLSYFYFRKQMQTNTNNLQIDFSLQNKSNMQVLTKIEKAIMPLWGYIKLLLLYDKNIATPIFDISNTQNNKGFLIKSVQSSTAINLPQIKTYEMQQAVIFFQDFLRLYSLPVFMPARQTFWNLPNANEQNAEIVLPKKTNETQIRIPELRRVDGEYLQYKKFTDSDDTRRIVWKLFAKNKELVVRTPEIFNPFASHIYFYASFYNDFNSQIYSTYNAQFLSYYKQKVFLVYNAISGKQFELKYNADQNLPAITDVAKLVTLSNWQNNKPLESFINAKLANIVILHSANNAQDVKNQIDALANNTTIYFVKLSSVLKQNVALKLLEKVFLHEPNNELSKIKSTWFWSPMRKQLVANEQEIENILANKNNVIFI